MKTTKQHFELYKKTCLELMDEYKLDDYDVFFEWVGTGSALATCRVHIHGIVTFSLNYEITINKEDKINDLIKSAAKHEVIHCLIGRYVSLAEDRFTTEDELTVEEEHLVRKLEKLL